MGKVDKLLDGRHDIRQHKIEVGEKIRKSLGFALEGFEALERIYAECQKLENTYAPEAKEEARIFNPEGMKHLRARRVHHAFVGNKYDELAPEIAKGRAPTPSRDAWYSYLYGDKSKGLIFAANPAVEGFSLVENMQEKLGRLREAAERRLPGRTPLSPSLFDDAHALLAEAERHFEQARDTRPNKAQDIEVKCL